MVQQQPSGVLSPEALQLFVAGLSGLAPEEIRKAKLLYLRNEISEIPGIAGQLRRFRTSTGLQVDHTGILADHRSAKADDGRSTAIGQRAHSQWIDVWREDLKGERFLLDGEEIIA